MGFILSNCNIFTSLKIETNQCLVIEDDTILSIFCGEEKTPSIYHDWPLIDLKGQLLVPGYIDTQVNGGAGVLFNNNPSATGIAKIGQAHRKYGTTGFLTTLISDDTSVMQQAIEATRTALANETPGCLGIHLEGPYLNIVRKGVHCESKITAADQQALQLLKQLACIGSSMVTLAPEVLPNGFIQTLSQAGVTVSIGHSNASYEVAQAALTDGVSGFTHLFNAMSPLTSREPGVVGAALNDANSWCGVIVDGHHVHPCTLNIAIAAKNNVKSGKGKIMLVTDAVHTVGVNGDTFNLAGKEVFRVAGKVTTAEGTLAGSDLDMASAVRNTVDMLGLPLEEALRMASLYPAQFLGIEQKLGRIQPGYQADLALLDSDLNVINTWIKGKPDRDKCA
jgi:N-acetylglucosamine-6-phosphate deacetylase